MDLSCTKCGGRLPPEAAKQPVTCTYCGTTSVPPPEVVVVGRLAPIAIPTGVQEETRFKCARCADWLAEKEIGATKLHACRHCGGIWLDTQTVERLKSARDPDIDGVKAHASSIATPDRGDPIQCPVCMNKMRKMAITDTSHVIDVCDAHGTWFDRSQADELRLFVEAFEKLREPMEERGFLARFFS